MKFLDTTTSTWLGKISALHSVWCAVPLHNLKVYIGLNGNLFSVFGDKPTLVIFNSTLRLHIEEIAELSLTALFLLRCEVMSPVRRQKRFFHNKPPMRRWTWFTWLVPLWLKQKWPTMTHLFSHNTRHQFLFLDARPSVMCTYAVLISSRIVRKAGRAADNFDFFFQYLFYSMVALSDFRW